VRTATDYSTVLKSVQSLGLLDRRRASYLVKIAVLLLALAGCWVAFAFLGDHWAQLGVAAALGVVFTQVLFLSHDAAHRQMFASNKANEWTALLLGTGLGGVSFSWWNNKHNRHHKSPNQIDKDPDIDASVVHFFPPESPPRSRLGRYLHERQGRWFFPLLLVEALNLHQQSVVDVFTRKTMKRRWLEITLLLGRLAAVPALAFIFLPAGLAVLFLLVQVAVTGVYLGSVFAVSHIGMEIIPADAKIDFLRRQVRTSRNIRGGRAASAFMGGLNYQIEHHLFPNMPRPNLRHARTVLRSFCLEHNITYHEVTIHRAWSIVVGYLNEVGLAGRHAYNCPTFASLR